MNELNLSKKKFPKTETTNNNELGILDIDNLSILDDDEEDILNLGNTDENVHKKIECFVKWFRQEDGFGFLKSRALNKEIFIHNSVLDPTTVTSMAPGDMLVCDVIQGMRGPQVDMVYSYTPQSQTTQAQEQDEYFEGNIKWFNVKSDFGFVKGIEESGNRDIFLPGNKLRSIGVKTDKIYPNQPVTFSFKMAFKDNYVVNKLKINSEEEG